MNSLSDWIEQQLRTELLRMQIDKISYDMKAERRRERREVVQIVVGIMALVIAAFAAGHFIK